MTLVEAIKSVINWTRPSEGRWTVPADKEGQTDGRTRGRHVLMCQDISVSCLTSPPLPTSSNKMSSCLLTMLPRLAGRSGCHGDWRRTCLFGRAPALLFFGSFPSLGRQKCDLNVINVEVLDERTSSASPTGVEVTRPSHHQRLVSLELVSSSANS